MAEIVMLAVGVTVSGLILAAFAGWVAAQMQRSNAEFRELMRREDEWIKAHGHGR